MYNSYYYGPFYNNRMVYPNSFRGIRYPRLTSQIVKPTSINLTKILDTTQKGINTVNQIIPIYKQVKPVFSQVSTYTKKISSFINKNFMRGPINQNHEELNNKTTKNSQNTIHKNNTQASSPFYK